MIEIGCQTYSLRTRKGIDMLAGVRKAGFRAIELWVGHADWRDPDSAPRVRRAAEQIGITIQAYSVGGFVRAAVRDVETSCRAAFRYAAALGVDLVTGIVDRRALPVVDALCAETGIRFAIENHWYADFARAADWTAELGTSGRVGATLDTGHLVAAGDDPVAALAALGDRLMNVHLKDVVVHGRLQRWLFRKPRFTGSTIGAGEVPLATLLTRLARDGYTGRLAIEDERPDLPLSELQAAHRACLGYVRGAATSGYAGVLSACTSSS